jgi:predicted MFS family arabinose efflux permease
VSAAAAVAAGARPRPLTARRALIRVAATAVLANSTWFSATAIVPALEHDWGVGATGAAWLVVAVQIGFITGSAGAAVLNLPDRVEPRRLIALAALVAAAANAALLLAGGLATALPSRFAVGVGLAGVYAPGVRLVATWFRRSRGLAAGVVVGALTLGSGTPHLVRAIADIPWQATILATSSLAVLAAVTIRPVHAGTAPASPPLDLAAAVRALRARPVRLVTLGYLGHMWELYALWSWLPAFVTASRAAPGRLATGVIAFAAIGVAGLLGAVVAGGVADRVGRTATTSAAMLTSAACCLLSPVAFGLPAAALLVVVFLWGATVIADSAQFSAAVTELAEARYAGSTLTLQLALGFALTIVSIRLVPIVAGLAGWRVALLPRRRPAGRHRRDAATARPARRAAPRRELRVIARVTPGAGSDSALLHDPCMQRHIATAFAVERIKCQERIRRRVVATRRTADEDLAHTAATAASRRVRPVRRPQEPPHAPALAAAVDPRQRPPRVRWVQAWCTGDGRALTPYLLAGDRLATVRVAPGKLATELELTVARARARLTLSSPTPAEPFPAISSATRTVRSRTRRRVPCSASTVVAP